MSELSPTPWRLSPGEFAVHSAEGEFIAQFVYHDDADLVVGMVNAQSTGWQPIETGPKDGTVVLLAFVGEDDGEPLSFVSFGHYVESEPDAPGYMGHDAGWLGQAYEQFTPSRSFGNPRYRYAGRQPTHWMPLPAPPIEGDGQ